MARPPGCRFAGGEPDPETITTNMMMPIMLLKRSWSFNAALNRGKETTEMLSLGTIEASPGVIRVLSVYFSV
jgi:hypothetical protein